ncbi:MAG: riboflavin synthase [Scytolyngbya sp. HA4215-MV1]|nr:riboflavin synthase [Scytolyngbya sp. HA4215-MV1]
MFTGLIQGLGKLRSLNENQLEITCVAGAIDQILSDLAMGDSVAVDGVCLTVVDILHQGFIADASPETLCRSTLGQLAADYVNLETSLRVGSKLGGHFVTGHVDGTGCLQSATQTATSWELVFAVKSPQISRYIIPKGSIAVNGVSLTISECDSDGTEFTVAVIPHTYIETNLQFLRSGSWVNLEGDILGKYVEKFLRLDPKRSSGMSRSSQPLEQISPDFLAEHGYW